MPVPFLRSAREWDSDHGGRPGFLATPDYSCGTAPDLHRLRLWARPSGVTGTVIAIVGCALTIDESFGDVKHYIHGCSGEQMFATTFEIVYNHYTRIKYNQPEPGNAWLRVHPNKMQTV